MGPATDTADIINALRAALQRSAIPGLISAYLFGSYAEGRAHRQSDVDLAVLVHPEVLPTRRDRFALRVRLSGSLGGAVGREGADVVVLNDAPPTLARHIVTRGLRLLCADEEADHAFVRDAQLRAADIAPFLRRTRAVKLAAIAR